MKVDVRITRGTGLVEGDLRAVAALLRPDASVLTEVQTFAAASSGSPQWGFDSALELPEGAEPMDVDALRFEVLLDGSVCVGQVTIDFYTLEKLNTKTITLQLERPEEPTTPVQEALDATGGLGKIEVRWDVPEEILYDSEEYEEIEESFEEELEEYEESFEEGEGDDEGAAEDQLAMSRLPVTFMADDSDRITAMRVGSRFLVVGTEQGWVHVLDFQGTAICQYQNGPDSPFINDLGIDDDSNFVGACSRGGFVRVDSVFGEMSHLTYGQMFDQPIQCMALCPRYEHTARFLIGGLQDKIVLVEHSTFALFKKKWQSTVLYKETGCIHAIRWRGDLVAWADDKGVKVFDIEKRQKIVQVVRDRSILTNLYKCKLSWSSDSTLLIAWANLLAICEIRQRPAYDTARDDGLPDRQGFVSRFLSEEYFITGVVPYGKKFFLLVYPDDLTKRAAGVTAPKPEMRLLDPQFGHGNTLLDMSEVQKFSVNMAGYEQLVPAEYHLACDEREAEPSIYIVSPTEIVSGRQCDVNDRIKWLLDRSRYKQAIKVVASQQQADGSFGLVTPETRNALLEQLFDNGLDQRMAELLPTYLGSDEAARNQWRIWVFRFHEAERFASIVDRVPGDVDFNLGEDVYEMILTYLLWDAPSDTGPRDFYRRVRDWPDALYSLETRASIIASAIKRRDCLDKPEGLDPPASAGVTQVDAAAPEVTCDDPYTFVSAGLAVLYDHAGEQAKALDVHLELGRSDVFDFINKHQLHGVVVPHVVKLLWKNRELTLRMLKNNHQTVEPAKVVRQLRPRPLYLYEYLHALYRHGSRIAPEFHEDLVQLYARYAPSHLPRFARAIQDASITLDAFDKICTQRLEETGLAREDRRDIYRARALVLGKSGERWKALELLIENVNSVKESVEFIVENDDESLFETLVTACFKGGTEVVAELLDLLGDPADPKKPLVIEPLDVIRRIDGEMEIKEMKQKIEDIIRDKALKTHLRDGCMQVMEKDVCMSQKRHVAHKGRGMRVKVDGGQACCACDNATRLRLHTPQGLVVLPCGHKFHEMCYYAAQRAEMDGRKPPPLPTPVVERVARGPTTHITRGGCTEKYGGEAMMVRARHCPFCNVHRAAPAAGGGQKSQRSPGAGGQQRRGY